MDIKTGYDSKGLFAIRYGPGGVKWFRGNQAEALRQHFSDLPKSRPHIGINHIAGIAGQIFQSVSQLGIWYEMRQMRMLQSAEFEERRITSLINCVNLLLDDMKVNNELDNKAAYYLSVEASGLFSECIKNDKIHIPGNVLYMCNKIRRYLGEFNSATHEYFETALSDKDLSVINKSIFSDTFGKIKNNELNIDKIDWLKYVSAEEQAEETLSLIRDKNSNDIELSEIIKSSAFLISFLPIPLFLGAGTAARIIVTASNIAKGISVGYSVEPLIKLYRNFLKSINDSKWIKAFEKYHDLYLLKLESANTTRILSLNNYYINMIPQNELTLIGSYDTIGLPLLEEPQKNLID